MVVVKLLEEFQGWDGRSGGKDFLIVFSAQASSLSVFFFKQYASGLGSTNHQRILRFNFSYETDFEPTVLLLKKVARCHPFLAVVRCLFHNHLRLKRSSLLNVYLNYKFEISLLTSRLFFSLFNLACSICFSFQWKLHKMANICVWFVCMLFPVYKLNRQIYSCISFNKNSAAFARTVYIQCRGGARKVPGLFSSVFFHFIRPYNFDFSWIIILQF